MSNNLEAIVKVIAYGVPALLIVLGFFGYVGGYTIQMVTGDVAMKNFGIFMVVVGIMMYVIEIAYTVYENS